MSTSPTGLIAMRFLYTQLRDRCHSWRLSHATLKQMSRNRSAESPHLGAADSYLRSHNLCCRHLKSVRWIPALSLCSSSILLKQLSAWAVSVVHLIWHDMKQAAWDMKWNALQNWVRWEALQYEQSASEYMEALFGPNKTIFSVTDAATDWS